MITRGRLLKLLYLAIGLGILAVVLVEADAAEVVDLVSRAGWGIAWALVLYFLAFLIDSFTWLLALPEAPVDVRWTHRIWKARMVGEVFNTVLPAAGMGGEPVKAMLLKKHHGLGYREVAASLIIARTINVASLVAFLAAGFVLMWLSPALSPAYKAVAGAGLAAFSFGAFLFWAIQRFRLSSVAGTWLARLPMARGIDGVLHHVRDMDDRLVTFYTRYRGRFWWAILLALVNWILGAVEIWVVMVFLGHPVSVGDAVIIEAAVQLLRAGAFFIPGGVGAQEGMFMILYQSLAGSPELGVAMALVRRIREAAWLLWGALIGWLYARQPEHEGGQRT